MIGGNNSTIEEFPYLVALEANLTYHDGCAGVIISQNHILTAAHCFKLDYKNPSSYRVRAGSTLREQGGTEHEVKKFILHFGWNRKKDDLVVVQLKDPIEFDSTKQPIPMFEIGEESKNGSTAVTAGWGNVDQNGPKSNQLRSINMNIVDKKSCNGLWERGHGIEEGEICASGGSKSACNGDSGSPLVINSRLAGIAAYATVWCTSSPEPNVFTEIAHYREWIDKTVSAMQ